MNNWMFHAPNSGIVICTCSLSLPLAEHTPSKHTLSLTHTFAFNLSHRRSTHHASSQKKSLRLIICSLWTDAVLSMWATAALCSFFFLSLMIEVFYFVFYCCNVSMWATLTLCGFVRKSVFSLSLFGLAMVKRRPEERAWVLMKMITSSAIKIWKMR